MRTVPPTPVANPVHITHRNAEMEADMSDSPDRYWLGIEKPVAPVILAAVLVPVSIIGFAVTLGAWWFQ